MTHTTSVELDSACTPQDIESRSFAIIDQELPPPRPFEGPLWQVARRCIHTLGDTDILGDLRLSAAGLEAGEAIVGDWTADFGYAYAQQLPSELPFTGVFCANDQMSLGLLHGLDELGLGVPGDVSVVGFDDIPLASHAAPPLTTVHQHFAGLGERAVRALLRAIDSTATTTTDSPGAAELARGERVDLTPELVVRDSTAPALTRRR